MWIEKLAVTAQEAFKSAMDIASKHEAATTEPLHLLAAILSADENNLKAIITRIGADPAVLKQRVDTEVEHQPKVTGQTFMGMVAPSREFDSLMNNAERSPASSTTITSPPSTCSSPLRKTRARQAAS